MTDKPTFAPTPHQALLDAGFTEDEARKAIITILAEGYEMPYVEPRKAFIMSGVLFQIFANSAEHAEKILEDSGIHDGPCEIHQDGQVLKVDYLNVEGTDEFSPADWNDYNVERLATEAGAVPNKET